MSNWTPEYPVVVIRARGAWVAMDEDALTSMHRTIIDAMYAGTLVDARGEARRILRAEPVRPAGFWARWKASQQQNVRVRLAYEDAGRPLALAELQEMVLPAMDAQPADAKAFQSPERWVALAGGVRAAATFAEVFLIVQAFDQVPEELR